ncbi:Thioredoxin reductase [Arboricoccus pini]|uniref:Thioredoxin reductase n=1 Tax=Arboricoccus pini TaxID=1963835 RepID=A0A212RS54_9PROT|nr:FAD-dependent oxidoreductase [Arboricoccus pini]SNB75329.1 Thioredoxin reductase [Arboricoccus pini]
MTYPFFPLPDDQRPDFKSIAGKYKAPEKHAQLLVIGAGPAGIAAAIEGARAGVTVMLVDEHPISPALMGMDVPFQFGGRMDGSVQNQERMLEQVLGSNEELALAFELGVEIELSTYAWGAWIEAPGLHSLPCPIVGLANESRSWLVSFDRLVLATGARDLNLSFEGSDQPGVMGAQALHALLIRYDAFAGRRLVVIGSDELALKTALLAIARGLEVAAIIEAHSEPAGPADLLAALAAKGVELITRHVPLKARGNAEGVTGLTISAVDGSGTSREIACDTVCLALGVVPVVELLDVLGLKPVLDATRGGWIGKAGADGATDAPQIYVAGDCAGLGGDAVAQGKAASLAALRSLGREVEASSAAPAPAGPDVLAYRSFWMRTMLATGGRDVLACVCEEVTRGELLGVQPPRYLGWRWNAMGRRDLGTLAKDGPLNQDQVKRLTRACMGQCQARRCREQVAMLLEIESGAEAGSVPLAGYRAPVRPLPLATLADMEEHPDMGPGWDVWFGIPTQWIHFKDIGTEREREQLGENVHL